MCMEFCGVSFQTVSLQSVIGWLSRRLKPDQFGLLVQPYFRSANSANSEIAGHTGASAIRKRTFVVVTLFPRTSLQLPMLVPPANFCHSLFFQISTANAS